MYSLLRHPLYFGNLFIFLGLVLLFRSIPSRCCPPCCIIVLQAHMAAEEDFSAATRAGLSAGRERRDGPALAELAAPRDAVLMAVRGAARISRPVADRRRFPVIEIFRTPCASRASMPSGCWKAFGWRLFVLARGLPADLIVKKRSGWLVVEGASRSA